MKKNIGICFSVLIVLMLALTACGEKSKESVVDKLESKVKSMSGYKAEAQMKMATGQEEQEYNIDVWFKKDHYYRVALKNDDDEKGSQVILKNDDGVFVLTPALNKNFKFQTEWPDNSSQPYLYQSLVKDVKEDDEAEFTATDSHYVFLTKTNYQSNNNLPYQEIHFDKKTYTPTLVKVLDKDKKPLVEVTFSNFELDATFKDDDFKIDQKPSGESNAAISEEDGTEDEEGTEPQNEAETEEELEEESELQEGKQDDEDIEEEMEEDSSEISSDSLSILFPLYTAGSELIEKIETPLDDGERVIMVFGGEKKFTLVQEKLNTVPTFSYPKEVEGDIINLGFAIGALSENTLEWNYNGVDFHLASEELTKAELIEVAQSVIGKEVK